ncbi:hypothetical protein HY734_02245 [Candidatus Uhrbacteria bacterium]|nr:hypothetical protein [Candidatus Uhrbacteria bacterium]
MATPEAGPAVSPEQKAAQKQDAHEKLTKEQVETARFEAAIREAAARRGAEGREKEAEAQARVGEQRARALERTPAVSDKPVRVVPAYEREIGMPANVLVDVEGTPTPIQELVPGAKQAGVEIVYGERFGVDPHTKRVTIPMHMKPKELPFLVREIARVANGGDHAISKELTARGNKEQTVREIREQGFWHRDFVQVRRDYKAHEIVHSKTVSPAEQALDLYMHAAAESYQAATGRDLYQDAGGKENVQNQLERQLIDQQVQLVYRYDEKGKPYLDVPEGAWKVVERMKRFSDSSDTVRDYRLHRKIIPSLWIADAAVAGWKPVAAAFLGTVTKLLIDNPIKIFSLKKITQGIYNFAQDTVDGIDQWIRKEIKAGTGVAWFLKPKLESTAASQREAVKKEEETTIKKALGNR